MANYTTLKASVNAYIKANGVRAITGPVLNGILTQMINTLGDGARYGGIATPSGNPGTHDNVVFFLATTAGTYTNYGGAVLDGSTLHILYYDSTWHDLDTGVPTSTAFATKADKDEDAVEGNIAMFDSNGNPVDGGVSVDALNQLGQKVDDVIAKTNVPINTTIEKTSYDVTSEYGYIASSGIEVIYSAAYMTYKITIPYSGYMYIDPNSYGNVGNIFRIGIERTSHSVWEHYYADVNSMPKEENKLQLVAGDILYVTIASNASNTFILQYEYLSTEYYLQNIKYTDAQKEEIALFSQKIKIHFVENGKFEVTIPQIGTDAEIVHNFIRQYKENSVSYGEGLSKNMVTADIWYPHQILVNGQNSIQGNLNFIYRLVNEGAHVGPGHGCEVSIFTKFFADGIEFNPADSFEDIYCDVFRIILKSDMYATSSPSTGTNAIPVLDENGDPIITAVHTLNATYRVNNIIDWDNNLLFKRDNVKFLQLHGGMVQGQASMFDTFTICDGEYTSNKFEWDNTAFVINPISDSEVLNNGDSKKASSVIMYGKNVIIKQYMERLGMPQSEADANDGQKANYCTCVYYSEAHDPRVKIYMQPTRSDMVNPYLAKEVFNSGDWLKLHLVRQIEVTQSL